MLTEHILRRLAVGKSTKKGSYFLFRGYPKGIQRVSICKCVTGSLTQIGSSAPTRINSLARYENDTFCCCRRVPELCVHPRILVREPSWERDCQGVVF